MTKKISEKSLSRRTFLKTSTLVLTSSAIAYGAVSVPLLRSKNLLLRPPGALTEDLFLASCIKCGQCLQVCPPQVIKLAGISQGFGIGTPYITPREGACILCSGLPCVLACPTGALDHHLSLGKDAKMGLAVISTFDTCLSVRGVNDLAYRLENLQKDKVSSVGSAELKDILASLVERLTQDEEEIWRNHFPGSEISDKILPQVLHQIETSDLKWLTHFVASSRQAQKSCQVCLDECPIKNEKPIVFEPRTNPDSSQNYLLPSVTKTCVGCGVCEEKCPTPIASITITPQLKWSEEQVSSQTGRKQS